MTEQETLSQYCELMQLGYVDGHKKAILCVLADMLPHSSDEVVMAGGKQYNARILELRRDGWNIVAVRKEKTRWDFMLLERERRKF